MSKIEQFLWTEKFRPHKVSDAILPSHLKNQFQKYVDTGNIPNLLLAGPPGLGKTTIAKAMVEEIGSQFHMINASLNGNIDTLRNEIAEFSSSVSMNGKRKYVILDEADYLNPNSFQPALRAFMEEFASGTGFILTCNFKSRIIEPLHSRCSVVDFSFKKEDLKEMGRLTFIRLSEILTQENIKFDKAVLVEVIKKHFPDIRRMISELQAYGQATGTIDTGILVRFTDERMKSLVAHMQQKNFTAVREWVTQNSDLDSTEVFRKFYDMASSLVKPESIPLLVMILARYQYQAAFVADPDINNAACFAEIMSEVVWK
jgi:DNA polymerase III delta prime subunit